MLDLTTYRIVIGYFNGGYHTNNRQTYYKVKHQKFKKDLTDRIDVKFYQLFISFILSRRMNYWLFLVLLSSIWLPCDSRYGKNRQRGKDFQNFNYLSSKEKSLCNQIRSLDTKLCRCESHLRFFEICLSKNIHLKNLNTHDRFNVAFSNDILNSQLQSIQKKYIKDAINAIITHFQLQCKCIKEELDDLQNSLKEICSIARIRILTS